MNDVIRSELLGTALLSVAAGVALVITFVRSPVRFDGTTALRTRAMIVGCVILQGAHFVEEYATGFYQQFPARLGLVPWSAAFFVSFNLVCLSIWTLAVVRLRSGARAIVLPLWFLAIGMMANGVAHPLLAVDARGYFPGLITAPVVGVAGGWLWWCLLRLTRSGAQAAAGLSHASDLT